MRSMVLASLMMSGSLSMAAPSYMAGKSFYVYSQGAVAKVEADGTISWRTPKITQVGDLWVTPASILYSDYHGAREVSNEAEHRELFHYVTAGNPETYSCVRLPNHNVMLAECMNARLLEVTPQGKIAREIKLAEKGNHGFIRCVRVTPEGTFLVCHMDGEGVREYDGSGKVLWAYVNPEFPKPYLATRLANGNTLISAGEKAKGGILEVTPDKKIVWSVTNADLANQLPGQPMPLKFCTGFFLLPNGNIVVANWIGHGFVGKAPHLLEITRDKKIVWSYSDFTAFTTVSNVWPLDEKGQPLAGERRH